MKIKKKTLFPQTFVCPTFWSGLPSHRQTSLCKHTAAPENLPKCAKSSLNHWIVQKPSLPHGFQEWINNSDDDDDVDLGASVNWLAVSCIEVSQTNKAGEGGGWSDDDENGDDDDDDDDDDEALPGEEEKMNKRKDKACIPLAARV